MPINEGYPRNKIKDMEKPAKSSPAMSWTSEGPFKKDSGKQLSRGTDTVEKISLGKIPNRKG